VDFAACQLSEPSLPSRSLTSHPSNAGNLRIASMAITYIEKRFPDIAAILVFKESVHEKRLILSSPSCGVRRRACP
jgi:hypothetical protein